MGLIKISKEVGLSPRIYNGCLVSWQWFRGNHIMAGAAYFRAMIPERKQTIEYHNCNRKKIHSNV